MFESSYKPTITIDETQLPDIKDWKVDGEYKVEMVIKQKSISRDEYNNDKMSARFEIVSVKAEVEEEQDLDSMTNSQFRKALADKARKDYVK